MVPYADFYITNDDGYPELRHCPNPDDDEYGCFVRFAEAGTNLDELLNAASGHVCGGES